jgi:uncharacterized protein
MQKRAVVFFGLFVLLFVSQIIVARAAGFPTPVGHVNDFANILSSETKQNLEQQLTRLEKDSSTEISVVTVETLGETTVEDYAVRLFENWQIGKKGKDNGILFLVAPYERETKIEVGYGLEPVLTDAQAGRILDSYVVPAFRDGDYNKGVNDGVSALIKIVHGEEVNLEPATFAEADEGDGVWILFVIGAIFLSYLTSFLARSKRWWPGGIIGAILGLILGFYLAGLAIKILAFVGLGILGLLFDFVLSKNYKERKEKGLPTSFWGSGGGFFGGGGGGFGGFGGGGSGGGGASRSW